jgi:hypothetical protein
MSEGEVDGQIQLLKRDLDAVAKRMEQAIRNGDTQLRLIER